ncbi:Hypp4851 [Branchiostoma lanceolatum]|uniref:Hypp4851 protein n=1 Tax=Branchiostoma lanceolatum TaxID=7740 RepID=A0A8K0AAP6_BRALA|nr:Hypp4851 [Branchiostoma lanceolatum]
MDENVYKEACNVYDSCNEDERNDYEEACTVSPSGVSFPRRAADLNPATGTPGVSGLPGSPTHDKSKTTKPGSVSTETTEYIPGVGMRSPGQSQVWTSVMKKTIAAVTIALFCCLMGVVIFLAVTVSGHLQSVSMYNQKTTRHLSDLKLSVSELQHKTDNLANVSYWLRQNREVPGSKPLVCSDVVPLGKALDTTFLTPPRCEWVPDFGWGRSYGGHLLAQNGSRPDPCDSSAKFKCGANMNLLCIM